jgi:hypothetical protein
VLESIDVWRIMGFVPFTENTTNKTRQSTIDEGGGMCEYSCQESRSPPM